MLFLKEKYLAQLANKYSEFADSCVDDDLEKADEYYTKALKIRLKLFESNPKAYKYDLAMSYASLGAFYQELGSAHTSVAAEYFEKAISLFEELPKNDLYDEKYKFILELYESL